MLSQILTNPQMARSSQTPAFEAFAVAFGAALGSSQDDLPIDCINKLVSFL